MKRLSFSQLLPFLCACAVLSLASCSKSLTDLGYESQFTSSSRDIWQPNTSYGTMSWSPVPSGGFFAGGSYTTHYKFDSHKLINDANVNNLFKAYVNIKTQVLQNFYADMNTQTFAKTAFSKEYAPLCSPDILSATDRFALSNTGSAIGGWQIFKPTPGLDEPNAKYTIAYEGDDWFSVKSADNNVGVRLRIVLTPDKLRPIIVAVDNPAFGISVNQAANTDLGKGYPYTKKFILGLTITGLNIFSWLNKTFARESGAKQGEAITQAHFEHFFQTNIAQREQLLSNFYSELRSPKFTKHKFSNRYTTWLNYDIDQTAYTSKDKKHNKRLGKWNAFTADSDTQQIIYEGDDWFRLAVEQPDTSLNTPSLQDIHVRIVTFGRDKRPVIVGLFNPQTNISAGADIAKYIMPPYFSIWRKQPPTQSIDTAHRPSNYTSHRSHYTSANN